MNIEHLKTFLEIADTGSFHRAAEHLNITQSTASARLKALEERLDRVLLSRGRSGAALTPAGQQFHRFAVTAVRAWEQGRQEVALPPGYRASFGIGAQASLWDRLLVRWVPWIRDRAPRIALRLNSNFSDPVTRQVIDGSLDAGVVYIVRSAPGLITETLFEERLVLVSTQARARLADALGEGYIHVDWGDEFRQEHARAFPDIDSPAVSFNLGLVALQYMLRVGGTGYFPVRVVREQLRERRLHRIRGAPTFRRPAFVVYPSTPLDEQLLALALQGLRVVARQANRDD